MRESKSMAEIFLSNYPIADCVLNDYTCSQAIGWLKGVKSLAPSWASEADQILNCLYDILYYSIGSKMKTAEEQMNELTDVLEKLIPKEQKND